MVRPVILADAAAIAAIYSHYVSHTHITFEEEPVSDNEMQQRIAAVQTSYPWLVYERNGSIEGYAYANRWHSRGSYRHTVETTVYLEKTRARKGVGSRLYVELIDALKLRGFRTAIGGIALPNEASVALHEKLGFTKVAHFKEAGWKLDRWIDVGYWQLMLR